MTSNDDATRANLLLVGAVREHVALSIAPLLARIATLEKERYIERTIIARLERRLDQRDEEVKAKRLEWF